MFKDYHKYLSTSLKVYTFLLVITFIMKIVGLDYFGLDSNNQIIHSIDIFITKIGIKRITFFTGIMIYQYLMLSIMCCDNSKRLKKYTLYTIPYTFIIQYIKSMYKDIPITYLLEFVYLIVICKIYNKNIKISQIIKVLCGVFILQFISNFTRNKKDIYYEMDYIRNFILNLDYFFMMLIYQKVKLEGGLKWTDIVGLFSQMKANLLKLPKRLQRNLHNFKVLDKETKLTYIIYFILSLIWNTLTIIIILLVARLNTTIIECLFILTSFWLSKRTFGKPFHLPSMKQCFIVSNLTYYILNRITTPLGISILIPIMLGVGLSYITSKLVKKTYKPLYKGMPNNLFEETILKVTDKDSLDYKICYDYFVNNKSALQVSNKYNYTYDGVKKIFKRVNDKIKGL